MNLVENAREALLAQLDPIEREAAEIKERLDEINQAKAPLEAALKALEPSKKSKPKAARKASKPCARKADVRDVCLALVKENPAINQSELKELAKDKLASDLGFSLSGVSLRLRECLSSDMFSIGPDGTVSITSATPDEVVHPLPIDRVAFS